MEIEYKGGKKEGEKIDYNEDGVIKMKSEYKEGKKDGNEIMYYLNGNK